MKNIKTFFRSRIAGFLALPMLLLGANAQAQLLLPSLSTEVQYPTSAMVPLSLNLDARNTKYLSNYAYANPVFPGTINIDGWSTDNDGGFSYGTSNSIGVYTGQGAVNISGARDVQVGYLQQGPKNYIVAAYYDNNVSLYGYDLYDWNLILGTVSKLYTYHFIHPNFVLPEYIPSSSYTPVFLGLPYPLYPAPAITSTMDYNRISMDISKSANKVAMVMTDNSDGAMYTAVGIVSMDTILLSPNLNAVPLSAAVILTGPLTSDLPLPEFDYFSGFYSYVFNGTDWDYFDAATGFYVRYFTGSSPARYHYSYYPIDEGKYISEFTRNGAVTTYAQLPTAASSVAYSPLIELKAVSSVTTPGVNPYYLQYWPDVAFSGDDALAFVFYATNATNRMNDLYISDMSPYYNTFTDFYTYTGSGLAYGPSPTFRYRTANSYGLEVRNTVDNRYISSDGIVGSSHIFGLESKCESLPLTADFPEIRAKIDAPDLPSSDWAITFAYKPSFAAGLYSAPYIPLLPVHLITDNLKNNIYVRSNYTQHILNNGDKLNLPMNTDRNISPVISYKPVPAVSNVTVAWASEEAGRIKGALGRWATVGVELNTASGALATINDYLLVADNPSFYCGDYPLVALSKHTDGLTSLYTCHTQEDASGTYSIMHKNKSNTSINTWRQAENPTLTGGSISDKISVAPNPFTNNLHITATEDVAVQLSDLLGRTLATFKGTANDVNKQLEDTAPQLSSGTYLLKVTTISGKSEVFKLSKQ